MSSEYHFEEYNKPIAKSLSLESIVKPKTTKKSVIKRKSISSLGENQKGIVTSLKIEEIMLLEDYNVPNYEKTVFLEIKKEEDEDNDSQRLHIRRKSIDCENDIKPKIQINQECVASGSDLPEYQTFHNEVESTNSSDNLPSIELNETSNFVTPDPYTVQKKVTSNKSKKITKDGNKMCTICHRQYANKSEHICNKHSNIRPFECEMCGKTFKRKSNLEGHLKLHTDIKNVICDKCGAAFHFATDLRRHMRRHSNDRPFKCEVNGCGKDFKDSATLRVHMRSHSGEKPYKCTMCDKSFSTSMGKNLHVRVHTGEKPYQCDYCSSKFSDRSTCIQHVRIHTGEKPYKCHICGKGTTQPGNLKSHLRHFHKIIVKHVSMYRADANPIYTDPESNSKN